MRLFMVAPAVLLAACSTLTYEDAYRAAINSPDWELCYVAISGRGQENLRRAVYNVMGSRRTDCSQHAAIVSAKLQADAAASNQQAALGMALIQAGQAKPVGQQSLNCRTQSFGTYSRTVCD